MIQLSSILETVSLFHGISAGEIDSMLPCLKPRSRQYRKGETILAAGSPVADIGIVLEGVVQIVREEYDGSRSIQAEFGPGSLFAEAFACSSAKILPVTVISASSSHVLFIDCRHVLSGCPSSCPGHGKLIRNMASILADRVFLLNQALGYRSKRTTREKLLAYLYDQAAKSQSALFTIPFDRQQLADYLCVERSAMSAELSKLKKEGLLDFHKSTFRFRKQE